MKDSRNVRRVYNMMRHDGNHQKWCGKIKELLIHFNFEDVRDLQQVEQPRVFLNNLECTEHEEDDIHLLLHCPAYHDLRVKYLSPFHSPPNEISFNSMLQMEDSNMITGSSLYIYHSIQRRKTCCDAL